MSAEAEAPMVTLNAVRAARLPMPFDYAYRPRGRQIGRWLTAFRAGPDVLASGCVAFVVRHPTHGTFLIDTGLHRDAHENLSRDFGRALGYVFRHLEPAGPPFDEQLRALGIEPDAVARVVMTHLHVDHTSAMRLLPRARFTVDAAEWTAARRRGAVLKGYAASHLPDADRVDLVHPRRDGLPHGPFAHTIDLFGDGSARLISTPGHSPGHLSVLLRTSGRDVLLVGDAAYTTGNIERQQLPLITDDDATARHTLALLRDFSALNPETEIVPSHDPTAWTRIGT